VSEDHISDLRWDQLLAGELTPAQREEASTHARSCDRCRARFEELSAEREAFRFRKPPPALVKRPRRLMWTIPIAGTLAVAALALLILRPSSETPGERTKGKPELVVYIGAKPDQLKRVSTGDQIFTGDLVQAGYTATIDGFGAVLSLDAAGKTSIYVPAAGAAMVPLPAGELRSFPASTQLDDVAGREVIAAIWCEQASPLEPFTTELQTTKTIAPREGCAIHVVTVDKAVK
jgi:anti-sigma factor RsiW